jgi:hypothetical protein
MGATLIDEDELLRIERGDRLPPGRPCRLIPLAGCQ